MLRREAVREYASGALWILPFIFGTLAVVASVVISQIDPAPDTFLDRISFQGAASAARAILLGITGTIVTVIALVLGLSVVALQLSSTEFSPRLLRNFLRDRPNQVALSVYLASFAYCATLLFTVGVGPSPEDFPRLAVSGSIASLFASMGMVLYFADHLQHSLQVEAIMRRVEHEARAVIRHAPRDVELDPPQPPPWAKPVPAMSSGYVQTTHPELLLPLAVKHGVSLALTTGVGQHVTLGSPLAVVWRESEDDPEPDLEAIKKELGVDVGIGFERTRQEDVAFGIRQLVDVAVKALSPAINDPYTAIQAIQHMSTIFSLMAAIPLGPRVARDPGGSVVVVPSRVYGQYLAKMCGLVRRYGASEPNVMTALLYLMGNAARVARRDQVRLEAIADQARLVAQDAEREIPQPADAILVLSYEEDFQATIARYIAELK